MKVIESNDHNSGMYHASNVLYDSCDDATTDHKMGKITWWMANSRATGDNAYFVVELGTETIVDRITLRNARNGNTRYLYVNHRMFRHGVTVFHLSFFLQCRDQRLHGERLHRPHLLEAGG